MKNRQRTIGTPVIVEGLSLHFGHRIHLEMKPALHDQGILIHVENQCIPANEEYIDHDNLERRTALKTGGVKVNTIEHLLAALHGFGIDNIDICLTSEDDVPAAQWEFPLLDGCARAYSEALLKAGIVELDAPKKYYSYPHSLLYSFNKSCFAYIPWEEDRLVITTTICHPHFIIDVQTFSLKITEDSFYHQLASARTFCTLEEVEVLKKRGLIKGGSLQEALVLGKDSFLNPDLKFQDEPVRHKMLDFLGDLKLLGTNLRGHFIVVFGGHKSHCAFVKKLKNLEVDYGSGKQK